MTRSNGGFNAAERARARESGPITIREARTEDGPDGQVEIPAVVYHPRRLTNRQLREVRRASRSGTKQADAMAKETEEYREAYEDALEAGLTDKDGKLLEGQALVKAAEKIALDAGYSADEVGEINNQSVAEQLHALLVDESMQPIPVPVLRAHIEEDLDSRDVQALMDYLFENDSADPTPTPTSLSATNLK